MHKQIQFKTIGMQRDLSESSFNPKFAYENKNIRITALDGNTLLSITNEKGTKNLHINDVDSIEGVTIGQAVIDKELVLFTTSNNELTPDRIYKLYFDADNTLHGELLYAGNLKFSTDNPIETLISYENENIKKVYWVDGRNQTRVINIATPQDRKEKWDDYSFDFTPVLALEEEITIKRNNNSSGVFNSGVIQYAFSYYNLYGQESNIFYCSPINHISHNDKGGSPEDKIKISFDITINNVDTKFDYLRIYSIQRSSIDGTPSVLNVADIKIDKDNRTISYNDNGSQGTAVDPTELLYIGGEEVIFGTIAQKDNTLFLGNATLKRDELDLDLSNLQPECYNRIVEGSDISLSGYYPYKNTLPLNYTNNNITTFKSNEYYRLGVQFQYKNGKWSNPIFISDYKVEGKYPNIVINDDKINTQVVNIRIPLSKDIIDTAISKGYTKARGVVVYPKEEDREVVLQGVLCPTVYNVEDRHTNSPFVQSSWFIRPNVPSFRSESAYNGSIAEFRHNRAIPDNGIRSCEIQCLIGNPGTPKITLDKQLPAGADPKVFYEGDIIDWVNKHKEFFFVDQSILTMHSPEIEFGEYSNINNNQYKLRIIGTVPLTSFVSDIDIQTETPPANPDAPGFIRKKLGITTETSTKKTSYLNGGFTYDFGSTPDSIYSCRGLISGGFWLDAGGVKKDGTYETGQYGDTYYGYMIYPWHSTGALNGQATPNNGGTLTAKLKTKKLSNLKVSYFNRYLNTIWNADGDDNHTGITPIQIFNSEEKELVKIKAPKNSSLEDISYYGNVDKIVSATRYEGTIKTNTSFAEEADKSKGFPVITTGVDNPNIDGFEFDNAFNGPLYFNNVYSTNPVNIKYKSSPHAVFAFNYTKEGKQVVMPTTKVIDGPDKEAYGIADSNDYYSTSNINFWNKDIINPGAYQDIIDYTSTYYIIKPSISRSPDINYDQIIPPSIDFGDGRDDEVHNNPSVNAVSTVIADNAWGYLYLAELYNDNVVNRFGSNNSEDQNLWLPAGEPINIVDKDSVYIEFTEGDTYFQRYDCLKTYPYTLEDMNSVTEIVSFMCETRINIDGRYDRNRGQDSNLVTTPNTFNKLNKVYSQKNNLFNYRRLNNEIFNLNTFPNLITWTKNKQLGSNIDYWTNITMASTLDLNGELGQLTSLQLFNNTLFAFQERGISQILYNENVQIASTEGVPIEIANSGKVSGKRYISNQIGCSNKWSICTTPYGIYFIDDFNKGIYTFDGRLTDISSNLGFRSWITQNSNSSIWNPKDFNNFVSYYDNTTGEVLFINKDTCLVFSEVLKQFTSFYSYEGTPYLSVIKDRVLSIKDNKVWAFREGDYNMFYGKYNPFYTTVIANPEPTKDKIFNTLEFRANSWDNNTLLDKTFDTLKVWNEYQEGEATLNKLLGRPSNLKKKFRIWRANIPRDACNNRDRMRNPWLYIKLSKEEENTNKTVLHDMVVSYFE